MATPGDPGLRAGLVVLLALAVAGVVVILRDRGPTRRHQAVLFVAALLLRFAAAVVLYEGGLLALIRDEDSQFWAAGAALHREWVRQGKGVLDLPAAFARCYGERHEGYTYLLGVLFAFVPPRRLTAAAWNCGCGAVTAVLVYRTALDLASRRAAALAGWAACLSPSLILWSALTVKEPVVACLAALALQRAVHVLAAGPSWRDPPVIASALGLLVPFRLYEAYVTTAAVLAGLVLPVLRRRREDLPAAAAGGAVALLLLATGALIPRGAPEETKFEALSLENLETFRMNNARGGSAVVPTRRLDSVRGVVAAAARGGFHLLLAPLPWQFGSSRRSWLAVPEMVLWWALVLPALPAGVGALARTRGRAAWPLLAFVLGMGLLYSLMFSNLGLLYRQRSQLLPWVLVAAAVGWGRRFPGRP